MNIFGIKLAGIFNQNEHMLHEMLNVLMAVFVSDFKWISLVVEHGWFTKYVGKP